MTPPTFPHGVAAEVEALVPAAMLRLPVRERIAGVDPVVDRKRCEPDGREERREQRTHIPRPCAPREECGDCGNGEDCQPVRERAMHATNASAPASSHRLSTSIKRQPAANNTKRPSLYGIVNTMAPGAKT